MEQKEEGRSETAPYMFPCEFWKSLRTRFLRTIRCSVAASEDDHDETKLLHITSQLNNYLWMNHYELFWQHVKMDT